MSETQKASAEHMHDALSCGDYERALEMSNACLEGNEPVSGTALLAHAYALSVARMLQRSERFAQRRPGHA